MLKQKVLNWNAAWKLSGVAPEWWKRVLIAVVLWLSPPRLQQ
jgi:hypothetical protein